MGRNKEEDKKHGILIFEKESQIKLIAGTNNLDNAKKVVKKKMKRWFENAAYEAKIR